MSAVSSLAADDVSRFVSAVINTPNPQPHISNVLRLTLLIAHSNRARGVNTKTSVAVLSLASSEMLLLLLLRLSVFISITTIDGY
jgi:hypothetical protein